MSKNFIWGNYNYNNIPGLQEKITQKLKDVKNTISENIENVKNNNVVNNIKEKVKNSNILESLTDKVNALSENINKKLFKKDNDNNNEEQIVNQFKLTINITDHLMKVIGTKEVIYYKINLYSSLSNKSWDIYHKYNEFLDLNELLNKFYINIPKIDLPKNINKIIPVLSEHRQLIENLDNFLKTIITRQDLISSKYVINFLKLENHYKGISLFHPLELYETNENIQFEVSNMFYYQKARLLFIGTGLAQNKLIDGITSKIHRMFKKNSSSFKAVKGQILIYNIISSHDGEIMFIELFSKDLYSEVSSLDYFFEKNCLCIGMSNGEIQLYKIYTTESSETSKEFVEYSGNITCHYTPILGCLINFELAYIYSFAKYDETIKISEINYTTLMKESLIIKNKLLDIDSSISDQRILICDIKGNVHIIDITQDYLEPKVIQVIYDMIDPKKLSLFKIQYIKDSNFLFVGQKDGQLSIYYIEDFTIKKIKNVNFFSNIEIRDVCVNEKNELYIALSNGSISIYKHNFQNADYILDAHLKGVCCLFWNIEKKSLLSGGEDKYIKMNQIPIKFPSDLIRENESENNRNIFNDIFNNFDSLGIYQNNNKNNYDLYSFDIYAKTIYSEDLDGWSSEIN